ncbi:MAG: hypothetical protein AAB834_05155 [Patescibacteria group bacterium]
MRRADQILVISSHNDAHIPLVQKHLRKPFVVIDSLDMLDEIELSFSLGDTAGHVRYAGQPLDNVRSVWYRKPTSLTPDHVPVPENLKSYSLCSLQRHFYMLSNSLRSALWVNDYAAMECADSKFPQLEMATELGMHVPQTLMTSDAEAAKAFIGTHKHCVVKAQSANSPSLDGLNMGFLTTRISRDSLPDLSNLHLAPAIFQEAIDPLFDVRVTVVGDQVFAAKISNKGIDKHSPILDWRIGHYRGKMRIEAFPDFPDTVARQCIDFIKLSGLLFGAIDMVMDKNGELWFLENNPNGQWGFVEICTKQPIGKALAMLLTD